MIMVAVWLLIALFVFAVFESGECPDRHSASAKSGRI
jgi:hypothetical protein